MKALKSPADGIDSGPSFPSASCGGGKQYRRRVDKYLQSQWFWLIVIALLSLSLRLIYFFQFKKTVYFNHLLIDPRYYWDWAGRIAAGDVLGHSTFDMSPLYPYLLGLYRFVFGGRFVPLYLIQILLGTLTVILTFFVAKKLFGLTAGVVAGLVLAAYKPEIMFNVAVMKANLSSLFMIALTWFLVQAPRTKNYLAAGFLLALTTANDGNYIVVTPFILHWVFYHNAPDFRLKGIVFILAGMVIAYAPFTIRNYVVSGEFTLIRAGGGYNFYLGSIPENNGEYCSPDFVRANTVGELEDYPAEARRRTGNPNLTIKESSDFWYREGIKLIREQPLIYLKNVFRRLLIFWNAYEFPDTYDYQFMGRIIPFLNWPLFNFAILGSLGLGGLLVELSNTHRLSLLALIIAGCTLSLLPFMVFGRLRMGMIPLLAVYAGLAVTEVVRLYRGGDARKIVLTAAILLLTATLVNWPLRFRRSFAIASSYTNLGSTYLDDNQPGKALSNFMEAIRTDHTQIDALIFIKWLRDNSTPVIREKARRAIGEVQDIYLGAANKSLANKEYQSAADGFNLVLSLDIKNIAALYGAAQAHYGRRDYKLAAVYLKKALEQQPDNPDLLNLEIKIKQKL